MIIAFCFGALLEALAGFGTPVAICTVMLIALRFSPLKAAVVALVANTAPVAFGAIAVPITTLASVTGLPEEALGAMVGRQTPILAVFVPFVLVGLVDGWRGLRETWPVALVAGPRLRVAQFVTSNYLSLALTDIVAALLAAGAVVLLVRIRPPRRATIAAGRAAETPASPVSVSGRRRRRGRAGDGRAGRRRRPEGADPRRPRARTPAATRSSPTLPYLIIIAAVLPPADPGGRRRAGRRRRRSSTGRGSTCVTEAGKPVSTQTFTLNWLEAAGTILLIAGIAHRASSLRVRPGAARSPPTGARWCSCARRSSPSWRCSRWPTS